jgi:hypothetical protein
MKEKNPFMGKVKKVGSLGNLEPIRCMHVSFLDLLLVSMLQYRELISQDHFLVQYFMW